MGWHSCPWPTALWGYKIHKKKTRRSGKWVTLTDKMCFSSSVVLKLPVRNRLFLNEDTSSVNLHQCWQLLIDHPCFYACLNKPVDTLRSHHNLGTIYSCVTDNFRYVKGTHDGDSFKCWRQSVVKVLDKMWRQCWGSGTFGGGVAVLVVVKGSYSNLRGR